MAGGWHPGDAVLWRSVVLGRVRWAIPHTLVADGDQVALYVRPGVVGRRPRVAFLDDFQQIRQGRWEHEPHVWHSHHVLRLTPRGRTHSLNLFWDESWAFKGWYVNLQEPLRPSPLGFDTRDQALDVVIAPDGRWSWKDEEHLARLVELGVHSEQDAREIRAEGERVVSEWPFPTGWEEWRPNSAWALPTLPEGWRL